MNEISQPLVKSVQVALIVMPFAPITHPSPAVSCLSAGLREAGIEAVSLYPALDYAKRIGLPQYQAITSYKAQDLLGEWIFSEEAFRCAGQNRDRRYLERYFPGQDHVGFYQARRMAKELVDAWALRILERKPKIVGCTSMFCQNCASLSLLRRIRELSPDTVTMMGGANCETVMGSEIHASFPWVDYLFSGESDRSFPDLCSRILRGERPGEDGSRFSPYILTPFDRRPGELRQLKSEQVENLDELPIPYYDDYFAAVREEQLSPYIQPGLMAETSRGCWWGERGPCTFCGLNGEHHKYRSKSPDRAYEELTQIAARHGIRTIELTDNVLDTAYCGSLMPRLAGQGVNLLYEVRTSLTKAQMEGLKKAGVLWVQAGIEHLNDQSLRLLHKGACAVQNLRFLKWCRQFGITVIWNHLGSIPLEEDGWCLETAGQIPLLHHLQAPSSPYTPLRFDRFSHYHSHPEAYGLKLRAAEAYQAVYTGLEPDSLDRIAYFFDNTAADGIKPMAPGQRLLIQRLREWIEQFQKDWTRTGQAGDGAHLPSLGLYHKGPDLLIIKDSRLTAKQEEYILEGAKALIYECCDAGAAIPQIKRAMERRGAGIEAKRLDEILSEFMEAGLMFCSEGRYLSLAVECPTLPSAGQHIVPGGCIRKKAVSLPDPSQLTVADMFHGIF